jgi:hypothetical protein
MRNRDEGEALGDGNHVHRHVALSKRGKRLLCFSLRVGPAIILPWRPSRNMRNAPKNAIG